MPLFRVVGNLCGAYIQKGPYKLQPMPKRQKCQSCGKGWCQNHVFQLNPTRPGTLFKKIQKFRLCPKLNKSDNQFYKAIPLMNKDSKYFTPSFILHSEQKFYQENDEKMLSIHLEKVESMQPDLTCPILVPKHGRKRKYCTVCQQAYQDYLDHIKSPSHKDKIRKNKFSGFIQDLCHPFQLASQKIKEQKQPEETTDCMTIKLGCSDRVVTLPAATVLSSAE